MPFHLAAVGSHVRAWTWRRLAVRDTRVVVIPLSTLANSPQEAVDRLAALVGETSVAYFNGAY